MTRRLFAGFALMFVVGLAVAGCGRSSSDQSANANQAISWAEKVCMSIQQGAVALTQPPVVDEASDPLTAKNSLVDYLGKLSQALDTVSAGIRNAGPPPVANGQAAVDRAMVTITETKTAVDGARTKLAQLSTTDPIGLQQALTDAGAGMDKLSNVEGPAKDLKANPDLSQAFAQAPTCKQLEGIS